ncbi:MAG: tellurite resistance TerB family protein [Cocleimonas sp.]|nr:tellurite resistance TerB family protein [Cocleimonas sp.]
MGTLGKVAMGIVVAKGIGKMMGGGGRTGGSGGGLGDLLGGLISGGPSKDSAGGLGGVLDSLGGGSKISKNSGGGGLGDLLNSALNDEAATYTTAEQESEAEVLLRAMIYAAKADGHLDDAEKNKILENLGDERSFVENELMSPRDVEGFIRSVPRGMEKQVYMMSLFAIDLDSNEEAHYLDELAKGLNISHQDCNAIHEKLGAPAIYS